MSATPVELLNKLHLLRTTGNRFILIAPAMYVYGRKQGAPYILFNCILL